MLTLALVIDWFYHSAALQENDISFGSLTRQGQTSQPEAFVMAKFLTKQKHK